MLSKKTRRVPLYNVIVAGLDEANIYDVCMESAKRYARFIEDMCPCIMFSKSVSIAEYLGRG